MRKIMNKEISLYPIFALYDDGTLEQVFTIKSTDDYNHYEYEMHHFIKFQNYERNKSWYEERGYKQRLILMRKITHQHLENPIYALDDELFYQKYHIEKSKLLFNKNNYQDISTSIDCLEINDDGCFDCLEVA